MVNAVDAHRSGTQSLPLVAIVTPVYNGAAYLAETMQAVQAQDYPNLVHVILDNASTDTTPEIIARYRNARVPLRVSRNPRTLPLHENWNAALALLPGEAKYFRVLCADDTIAPQFVSRTVGVAERHPNVGVVGCLFHRNDGPTVDMGWPSNQEVVAGHDALAFHFRGDGWLPSSHTLYRSDVIGRDRPFFPDKLAATDLAAALEVLTRQDLGIVHEDLAMTRLHVDNVTSVMLDRERRHLYEELYFIREYAHRVLGRQASEDLYLLYQRYYLRQLLKWRFGSSRKVYDMHMKGLELLGMRPGPGRFADAIWDWALVRLGQRKVWRGYPF
jgi:glycosyltransferase involved in cell wall biosynthesis